MSDSLFLTDCREKLEVKMIIFKVKQTVIVSTHMNKVRITLYAYSVRAFRIILQIGTPQMLYTMMEKILLRRENIIAGTVLLRTLFRQRGH